MNADDFIDVFRQAAANITDPRFYESERGYQGQLLIEMSQRLQQSAHFPGNAILEQEYQKRARDHGTTIRTDIILHIPFVDGVTSSRNVGNFVAVELKLRATRTDAEADFDSLKQLREVLDYPLTIFLNIDADCTFSHICPQEIASQTYCCAVKLENGNAKVTMQRCG